MQSRERATEYEIYEDAVRRCCGGLVESLPHDEQALLWLWSDNFYETWDNQMPHEIPYSPRLEETVAQELYERVWQAAEDEILPDNKLDR